MGKSIILFDGNGRYAHVLEKALADVYLPILTYTSRSALIHDINTKQLFADDMALLILVGTSDICDPFVYGDCYSLMKQFAAHGRLKHVPLLFMAYRADENLATVCREFGAEYDEFPVKKDVLLRLVVSKLDGYSLLNEEKSRGTGSEPVEYKQKEFNDQENTLTGGSEPVNKLAPTPAGRTIESERRLATVMFADIAGFTAMSEKMDPEEVTGIMNACFEMLGVHIEDNGGHIDKFIGDCVMVCFGIPSALENAPLSAVNTAIAMKNGLYRFNREKRLAIPLDIHIGINTGMVVSGTVGSRGRKDYTVMGDAVNLASRIEGVAEKGQILVGPDTFRVTRDDFQYRVLAPVAVKGKAEPVPVYQVLSVKEAAFRRRDRGERACAGSEPHAKSSPDRMIYSALVGRERELNLMRLQLMKVINGQGGIVSIVGEAGIGKSRLMAELKSDPSMKGVTLLEGRAVSMGRNLSFHPIIDLLKSWSGITDDDDETAQLSKLEKAVGAVHSAEAGEIVPFAATLMGMKLSGRHADRVRGIQGEALEKLIFKNIRELLIKGAALRPMILYIEDLHWADTSSIELLSSLVKITESSPVLFVLVYRPNYEETSDRVDRILAADFAERHVAVAIEPLSEKETCALIGNLLNIRGLPRRLQDQIKERAGGNPFFVEEVVRSFIDEGAVVRRGDNFVATDKIHDMTVPMTINEVLMGRIDRLDEETRNLVKTASVIGRSFFHKIIAQVAGDVPDIEKRLAHLEDIQLIRERKRMDELEYLFKHALAQEAAYESILIQKRKELHLSVARAIEREFTGRLHEFYGMLAYHFSRGENLDKAEEYMLKAGEVAMKVSASSEALQLFKEALGIYRDKCGADVDKDKVVTIEKNIAIAYYNRGLFYEAAGMFRNLLDYYHKKRSRYKIVRILDAAAGIAQFLTACYFPSLKFKKSPTERDKLVIDIYFYRLQSLYSIDSRQMLDDLFDALKLLSNIDFTEYPPAAGFVAAFPAILSVTGMSYPLAKRILKVLYARIDTSDPQAMIWHEVSKLLYSFYSGRWDLREEFNEAVLQTALKHGLIFPSTGYLAWHSNFCFIKGEFSKVEEFLKKNYDLAVMYDHGFFKMVYYVNRVGFLEGVRRIDEAVTVAEEGISLAVKLNEEFTSIQLYSNRSYLYLLKGDVDESLRSLGLAREKLAGKTVLFWAFAHYYRCEFSNHLFQIEGMLRTGRRQAFDQMKMKAKRSAMNWLKYAIKSPLTLVECFGKIGVYYWLVGKPRKALRCWRKSIDIGEKLGANLDLSRAYFEAGKRALTPLPPFPGGEGDFGQRIYDSKPSPSGRGSWQEASVPSVDRTSEEHSAYGGAGVRAEVVKKILGLTPEECLDRAESMFREMGLEWDLAELAKVRKKS